MIVSLCSNLLFQKTVTAEINKQFSTPFSAHSVRQFLFNVGKVYKAPVFKNLIKTETRALLEPDSVHDEGVCCSLLLDHLPAFNSCNYL